MPSDVNSCTLSSLMHSHVSSCCLSCGCRQLLMQSEMDAADEELGSPPTSSIYGQGSGTLGAGHQLSAGLGLGSLEACRQLSAYERVRMRMLPEMATAVQMFSASVCDAFGKSLQSDEDVRQVRRV